MGQLVDCAEKFASLSGNVVRVAEMDAILTALEVKGATNTATASDVDSGGEQLISFENVDLVTPSGVAIAANIDCTVTADTRKCSRSLCVFVRSLIKCWNQL